VTFNPNVMTKSVTIEGDVYDPSGTMTGGSAPSGNRILVEVQELLKVEAELDEARNNLGRLEEEERRMKRPREQWTALTADLEIREHQLKLMTEQIEGGNAARVSV
jgi:structural maintenance of chromosome 2